MFNRKEEFNKDLNLGKWGEGKMISFIEEFFNLEDRQLSYWYSSDDISKKTKDLKKWDQRYGLYLKSDRINFVNKVEFEIKTDFFDKNTGNLIFEKSCNNKKSGVFATEAKYFIYFLPLYTEDNIYIIKSENLIKCLDNFNNQIISGGDQGSNTMMYNINRIDFNDVFKTYGGKIITWNKYTIPSEFNKTTFKKNYTYHSDIKKEYDDDDILNF
jgi:hypothetical protein